MYNVLASAQAGWRQTIVRAADRAPEVAGALHVVADPARKPWAVTVGTFALSAPATDARFQEPRGTPLV